MRRIGILVFVAACSSGSTGTTQSDCDKIAEDLRRSAGDSGEGVCSSTAPADVQRFGEACRSLNDCKARRE